jgi:ABC-type sugar transport system ATPase subunit
MTANVNAAALGVAAIGGAENGSVESGGIILSIQGITKEFDGVKVLDNVSFDLKRGEIMGLIGENGAGKSTLIKIITGIYAPSGGSLALNGRPAHIPDYITAKNWAFPRFPRNSI